MMSAALVVEPLPQRSVLPHHLHDARRADTPIGKDLVPLLAHVRIATRRAPKGFVDLRQASAHEHDYVGIAVQTLCLTGRELYRLRRRPLRQWDRLVAAHQSHVVCDAKE